MLKRPFKSVIARIAVLALALSLVFPFIPAALADSDTISLTYAENGTGPVATFRATDQDGDAIQWSLDGADKKLFTIDSGVLAFKESPDYEKPKSASTGTLADLNVYNIDLKAGGGSSQAVKVTVTDVDEAGVVSFDKPQPQVSRGLVASLTDQDKPVSGEKWQWARSSDMETWTDIDKATTANRNPVADDVGSYLRATVTYTDKHGAGQSASGVTDNKVEARTVANAKPSFEDLDETTGDRAENPNVIIVTRKLDENTAVGTPIGDPVSATDADNDILVYSIVKDPSNASDTSDDEKFTIDSSSGQLKSAEKLNYEVPNDVGGADNDRAYTVTVKAEDPSGASAEQLVTINLEDVNEAPHFVDGDPNTEGIQDPPTVLNVVEATSGAVQLRVGATGTAELPTAYNADDVDANLSLGGTTTAADNEADAALTLSGDDAKYFNITDAGVLTLDQDQVEDANNTIDYWPDYEKKSSYSITIVATSGTGQRTLRTTLDVTVHVIDAEDKGEVSLSQREPQVDQTVIATVSDPDGGVTVSKWAWHVSEVLDANEVCRPATEDDPNTTQDETNGPDTWSVVPDETSAAYTPVSGDVGKCLRATVTYTDAIAGNADPDTTTGNTETERKTSERKVQDSDPANTAPKFPDQDLATQGDQSDEATRSVAENKDAKTAVGSAIAATDTDLLLYSLSGNDADSFKIDNNGQITTAEKLDYESKAVYMVVVTATDPSGAQDSILVTINVTDVDDAPAISVNAAPEFADDSAERSVDENSEAGTSVGDPVTATDANGDTLAYALSGDDAAHFAIDEMGQITVGEDVTLDHEAEQNTYVVTVTATDPVGESDSIAVTISVNDVKENDAPVFEDESYTRNVPENSAAGATVGDPVTATDANEGDEITYSLSGSDAFAIGEDTGQITVAQDASLDYETTTGYTVTVTASDGQESASAEVTVNVGNVGLPNPYDTDDSGSISKVEAVNAVKDYFDDELSREDVLAVIRLYFG